MPFTYAFNSRELASPALDEIKRTTPIANLFSQHELFTWWLSVTIERIYLIECVSTYPTMMVYPYLDFVCLDAFVGDMTIYRRLSNIISSNGYNRFSLNITSSYDGFLVLEK